MNQMFDFVTNKGIKDKSKNLVMLKIKTAKTDNIVVRQNSHMLNEKYDEFVNDVLDYKSYWQKHKGNKEAYPEFIVKNDIPKERVELYSKIPLAAEGIDRTDTFLDVGSMRDNFFDPAYVRTKFHSETDALLNTNLSNTPFNQEVDIVKIAQGKQSLSYAA